ncbi:DUF2804 domain-containing protein [Treponema pedis]|uniref:DUF2804 domain-containing protein n=1 Tax=Treponema pedis str. T A4 TaxID=1291379 RepID=S6A2N1_9SPIR|nr:DUF2804 domain-containing protein [Treponema pedis]AGT42821.1 hypothetical protein TPE_0325 [Treponema pedis str. T A4]
MADLYTRKIEPVPEVPVKNGKAIFGSFSGRFKKLDIRGLPRPFGNLPIPRVITNMFITGASRFLFCGEEVIGEAAFFSSFIFSFMETTFWLRKTGQKFAYRQYLPGRFIHQPKHINYSVTACRSKHRYARIFSRLSHGKLHADFDFLTNDFRPSCEGRLDLDITGSEALNFSCVVPYNVSRKCQAISIQSGTVKGWISLGYKDDISVSRETSVGLYDVRKTYTGLRTKRSIVTGLGKINGKSLIFQINTSVAPDSYRYNENIMLYNGSRTPIPPVRITRPYGFMGKWIIQDMEGMVDLVFIPISDNYKKVNAIIFSTEYHTVYGNFEGILLTSSGEELKLKAFPGIIKKYNMRI